MRLHESSRSGMQQTNKSATVYKNAFRAVLWLQGVTLIWMLVECAVSLYAAYTARSAALLAFGSDSLVELLSATVVLFAILPSFSLTKARAAHLAGILLFVLAGAAVIALVRSVAAEAS